MWTYDLKVKLISGLGLVTCLFYFLIFVVLSALEVLEIECFFICIS